MKACGVVGGWYVCLLILNLGTLSSWKGPQSDQLVGKRLIVGCMPWQATSVAVQGRCSVTCSKWHGVGDYPFVRRGLIATCCTILFIGWLALQHVLISLNRPLQEDYYNIEHLFQRNYQSFTYGSNWWCIKLWLKYSNVTISTVYSML